MNNPNTIYDKFYEFFEMIPANDDALRKEVYKLRYQVYCLETGFEKEEDCVTEYDQKNQKVGLETDAFDARSSHFLVKHRRSNLYAATVRLVLPDNEPYIPYPIETHCKLSHPITDSKIRRHVAEISRLAVSKNFKKRTGEAGTTTGISPNFEAQLEPDERRIFPHITISLFAAIVKMTRERDITHWYAVMEPTLLRLLKRFGIHFSEIGPKINYHGMRSPCMAVVDDVLPSIKATSRPFWDLITDKGEFA